MSNKIDKIVRSEKADRTDKMNRDLADSIKKRDEEIKKLKGVNKGLAEKNTLLANLLEDGRKVKAPKLKKGRIVDSKDYKFRVVIPDSHGNFIEMAAATAFLKDLENLKMTPNCEIVMLGDHLEVGGFFAEHQPLGFIAEVGQVSYSQDIASTNWFLDEIQARSGGAKIHYIEGNHEQRIERWCVDKSLRSEDDAQLLLDALGAKAVLKLDERGINYYRRSEFQQNFSLSATIKLGKCYFTHGYITSKNAASGHLSAFMASVVYGHTHREDTATMKNIEGTIFAASPGCLSQTKRLWAHRVNNWTNGYSLQIVGKDEDFLHINVPIRNGKSHLKPLLDMNIK